MSLLLSAVDIALSRLLVSTVVFAPALSFPEGVIVTTIVMAYEACRRRPNSELA